MAFAAALLTVVITLISEDLYAAAEYFPEPATAAVCRPETVSPDPGLHKSGTRLFPDRRIPAELP